jgi:hypothetical protein
MLEQLLQDVKGVIPEPLWNVLMLVIGITVSIWTLIRSFVFVQPGQVGIRKRFGKPILTYQKTDKWTGRVYTRGEIAQFKAFDDDLIKAFRPAKYGRPKYLYPGFNGLIPLIHSVEIVNIQINNVALGDQRVVRPEDYIAYDLPEATLNLRLYDPYLWMIASADAEAQIKAVADTQLGTILRDYSIEQVLNDDPLIHRWFKLNTMFDFNDIGATLDSLKPGPKLLSIDASFAARSRREIAESIVLSAEFNTASFGASTADD